jgi:hypothetical protein
MTSTQVAPPSANGNTNVPKPEPARKRITRRMLAGGGLIIVLVVAAIVA